MTVVEYTDRVDVRLPWSHISSLGPDVFEAARAAKPTARAAAISYAASELERSGRPRKVLVIVGDACDLTGYVTPFDEGPEIMNLVFGSLETCEHVHDQIPYARVVRKPEHIRFALADAIGPSWYARFDVRSLGVLETGDRELVLDVAGYVSDPIRVSFPGPEPSWFSSRLRQLGLGALLVGLIALAIRSRFRARAR